MNSTPDIRRAFTIRLRRLRNRMALVYLFRSLATAVPVAFLTFLAVRFGFGADSRTAGLAAGILSGAWFLWSVWRNAPDLSATAKAFDLRFRSNSRVTNALELSAGKRNSDFALHAVADGLAALNAEKRLPLAPFRMNWKTCGVLTLAALAAILLRFPGSGDTVGTSPQEDRRTAGVEPEWTPNPDTGVREERRRTFDDRSAGSASETATASAANRLWRNSRESVAPAGGKGGEGVPGRLRESAASPDPSGEEDREDSERKPSRQASSDAAGVSGGWQDSEPAAESALLATGDHAPVNDPSQRRKRPRQLHRNPESALSGTQPMLADQAPPAGRELSEKDGEGDEPDSGRGGPNEAKKSRGTASMLPVTPLPDLVNGLLAPGEEMTVPEAAPPLPDNRAKQRLDSAAGGVEPAVPERFLPLAIRKKAPTP